jgi:hypothetical protein
MLCTGCPESGPLVIVANHPFGVLDGLIISYLTSKVRDDFLVLTNSVLYQAEEIQSYLLPIDFAETKEALGTNLKSRSQAKEASDERRLRRGLSRRRRLDRAQPLEQTGYRFGMEEFHRAPNRVVEGACCARLFRWTEQPPFPDRQPHQHDP